ncbi:hypothetical protein EYF80_009364 [Liparis tanakae]|uniref:Uncharacterized protein n=1 Tax=Liparis tanakae TaxID=230148 RepID=A0A4Z2IQS2_9TELE|nr:hypothetical protein EYF80_009364 [Liparis tanakae]
MEMSLSFSVSSPGEVLYVHQHGILLHVEFIPNQQQLHELLIQSWRSATGDFLRFCFSTSTCILAMGLAIARASFASVCSFFCRLRKSMSSRDSESSSVVSLSE